MTWALQFRCDIHSSPFECGDNDLIYNEVFDEYGMIHHNPEGTYTVLRYCPFCGDKLPRSMRKKWMNRLEKMGFDLFGDQFGDEVDRTDSYTKGWRAIGIPESYLTADWRLGK
jgi:hypothetical protein